MQNSPVPSEVATFVFKYDEKLLKKWSLLNDSESSKPSQNSQKDTCIKITEHKYLKEITLPLKPKQLQEPQKNDMYCRDIAKKLHKDVELQKIFIKENGVLYRLWIEDGRTSNVSWFCKYYRIQWPGIRKQVFRHCRKCAECILQNQGQAEKGFSHFDSPDLPMEFICMGLVGPIHPASSQGNKYVLTVIDMLTWFTMAVPIQNKNANTICDAYRDHIYCTFGGSSRILTDNGSEFKNKKCDKYMKL